MTAAPKPDQAHPRSQPQSGADTPVRKAWIKKTPVEIVLDQIQKQETRVQEMEKEFNKEKRELQKLLEAKKVLEAK